MVLEHDSKVSQLQLVCSASGLQVSVVQKMNATDFKWLTQMRGTPLPNQPDLFYFRCALRLIYVLRRVDRSINQSVGRPTDRHPPTKTTPHNYKP